MKKCTLIRVDNGEPFVLEAQIVTNPEDGSISFQVLKDGQPTGQYVGQEPRQYGVRHDGTDRQQYQRASRNDSTVTFVTRPEDPAFVYLLGEGTVFPS